MKLVSPKQWGDFRGSWPLTITKFQLACERQAGGAKEEGKKAAGRPLLWRTQVLPCSWTHDALFAEAWSSCFSFLFSEMLRLGIRIQELMIQAVVEEMSPMDLDLGVAIAFSSPGWVSSRTGAHLVSTSCLMGRVKALCVMGALARQLFSLGSYFSIK